MAYDNPQLNLTHVTYSGIEIDLSAPESANDELNTDDTSTAPVI